MKIFPGFYQLASNFRNVKEPEKEILYDVQVSEDHELVIYMLHDGKYQLCLNDHKKANKFYSIFPIQTGDYEFISEKIADYYNNKKLN